MLPLVMPLRRMVLAAALLLALGLAVLGVPPPPGHGEGGMLWVCRERWCLCWRRRRKEGVGVGEVAEDVAIVVWFWDVMVACDDSKSGTISCFYCVFLFRVATGSNR